MSSTQSNITRSLKNAGYYEQQPAQTTEMNTQVVQMMKLPDTDSKTTVIHVLKGRKTKLNSFSKELEKENVTLQTLKGHRLKFRNLKI